MINVGYDVVIAGAGPTGLALAGEPALKDLKVLVLERRAHRSEESRALGIHGRTLDLLAQRGLDGAFLARGHPVPQVRLRFEQRRQLLLDLSELDTDFGHLLIPPQSETERILEEHAVSLGMEVRREAGVFALKQDRNGVTVRHGGKNPGTVRTSWVVGGDGSKSNVRETIGAKFIGRPYPYTILVADVLLDKPPADDLLIEVAKLGLVVCTAFGDGYYRLGIIDRTVPWSDDPRHHARDQPGVDQHLRSSTWARTIPSGPRASSSRRSRRPATARAACCWPATPLTCTPHSGARVSTSVSRMPSISGGSWRQCSRGSPMRACWTATRPSDDGGPGSSSR